MKYTVSSLLCLALYSGIAFASITNPVEFWAELLPVIRTLLIGTSCVLALRTAGMARLMFFTFAVFALLFALTNEVPHTVESWLCELLSITRGGTVQDSRFFFMGDILDANAAVMTGLIASLVTGFVAAFRKSADVPDAENAEPDDARESPC